MAIGDYILCSKCECKLVYDGRRDGRDWLEERFQTRSLMCPDCLDTLTAEVEALRAKVQQQALDAISLMAQVEAERDALRDFMMSRGYGPVGRGEADPGATHRQCNKGEVK